MDEFLLEEVLKSIPFKYYVINIKTKNIIKTNDDGINKNDLLCFKQIYNKDLPCSFNGSACVCELMLGTKKNAEFVNEKKLNNGKQFVLTKTTRLTEDLVLETVTDITNEKLLNKEIKINTKRLERAEKLANFGYWEFSLDDESVLASEGARKIYGVGLNEKLEIHEVQKYPLPKYRRKLDKSLYDLIHDNKPYDLTFEIKRKNSDEIRLVRSVAEYRKDKSMVFGVLHDITESDKAQKALVESEKNLQLLFQNMYSGFASHKIIVDKDGNPVDYIFLDVNNKFEELTGLKGSEIAGKRVKEVFPNTEECWIQRYGKVALTGEPVKFVDYAVEFDKYFEVSAYSPQKNFFAATFTDVTERFKSARELDDTLKDLKLAQKIAKLGNWQYNPENDTTEWSEEVYKIIERDITLPRFTREEYKLFFGNENYDQFSKLFNKAVEAGVSFQFQFKANLPDCKTKWFELICQPDSQPGAKGYRLKGTIQDIDESKQVEVELNNSNKLLRTVIDNIPDAIYMKDTNFRKIIANKIDAQRSHKNIADLVDKTDYEIYPNEIAEKYTQDDQKVIETGKPIINREEILPDGDKLRWVLTSKIPLRNDENEIIGLVGIGRDITEIKENESRLKLLQQVIEQSPLSVIITDTKGKIEYVNPGFEKATGYSRTEVIGENPRILNSGLQDKIIFQRIVEYYSWRK